MQFPPIHLASRSPRRKQLLEALGFEVILVDVDYEEKVSEQIPTIEVSRYHAIQKARSVVQHINDEDIILAADTTVLLENRIFHKPKDQQDAFNILEALSGRKHQVITGVCIKYGAKEINFSECADVYMAKMTSEEMLYYIDQYKPYDKAGSYGIQEWIGLAKIEKIEGSYFNIVGLPTHRVYQEIQNILQ